MKISQLIRGGAIGLVILSFFSCKKTIHIRGNNGNDTTVVAMKQKCDIQHHCPLGYICDSGYCKKEAGCNCLVRPVPPGCAPACGP